MLGCGVREAVVMAPPPTCESAASSCFHGCLAFFHGHFPPQYPPSHPLSLSLRSQQQQPSPWVCFTVLKLQLPALCLSGDVCSCLGYVWLWQGLSYSHSISVSSITQSCLILCNSMDCRKPGLPVHH